MLVLSRKVGESVVVEGGVRLTVVSVQGKSVRVGVEAPRDTKVLRGELCAAVATSK